LTITDADIFELLKLQLKHITVYFFFMQVTKTIGTSYNESADCNKLGTCYTFKQYQQQEMKSNSILFGTPILKVQNDKI